MKSASWPQTGYAHDTGRLYWGMWVCECPACIDLCREAPDMLLVIKAAGRRRVVTARQFADKGATGLTTAAVQEVFVGDQWYGRFPPRSSAPPKKPRHWSPPILASTYSVTERDPWPMREKFVGLPPATTWVALCPCGEDPTTCAALAPVRELAGRLHEAFLAKRLDGLAEVLSPEVAWGRPGTRDAIVGHAAVLDRFKQLHRAPFDTWVIDVRVSPASIQITFEAFLPFSENLAVVREFWVDDGMISQVEGPPLRAFRDSEWISYEGRRCPYCGTYTPARPYVSRDEYDDGDDPGCPDDEEVPFFDEQYKAWA